MILRNPSGRSEAFVEVEVHVGQDTTDFDVRALDDTGKKRLSEAIAGRTFKAVNGVARIAWKNQAARAACVSDHQVTERRKERWRQVQASAERMRNGEFPLHGHVYVADASIEPPTLSVIDGTRRMLAYLESGHTEMPVIVLLIADSKQ